MKILFMGTPDIAAASLERLARDNFEIVGVVTQPDKPRGRKQVLTPPETKVAALKLGLPVFQPEKIKNGELDEVLNTLKPDLIAVVAYGKILPDYVLNFPKYGCINMHGSLLPKYRGAAPIQWSVINGDKITGVTTIKMDKGVDTGDMLLKKELEIGEYETSEELFERMAQLGAQVLSETIKNIETIVPVPQDNEKATHAPMLSKEAAEIDWTKTAREISKLICGMNSWPIAYTHSGGQVIKIYSALVSEKEYSGECGEIVCSDNSLIVKCGVGSLIITELQTAGGKRMSASDYLRGHKTESGIILGR